MSTPRSNAGKDQNFESTLIVMSSAGDGSTVALEGDPVTGALLTSDGGQIVTSNYDYVSAEYPNDTTEVFTYKIGGAAGLTVATVTMVYTDSTKANISTITRT